MSTHLSTFRHHDYWQTATLLQWVPPPNSLDPLDPRRLPDQKALKLGPERQQLSWFAARTNNRLIHNKLRHAVYPGGVRLLREVVEQLFHPGLFLQFNDL